MTAGELLAIIRADYLDDVVGSENWSDTQLLREIGRAQQQACYRQDLRHLIDSFQIMLIEGQRGYELDPVVLRLDDVSFAGVPLIFTTRAAMDQCCYGWRNYEPGIPKRFYVMGRTLYMDREPSINEDGLMLDIQHWRLPLILPEELAKDDDLEWINDPEQLAHWVAFRAFMRRDEDTQDKEKAAEHPALFNASFGAEVPAQARSELLAQPDTIGVKPLRNRPVLAEEW